MELSVYGLRSKHLEHHPGSHYFDEDTLRYFGESLSTMSVLKGTVEITDICGEKHTCYVLSKYQRKHPLGPRRVHDYFDATTFRHIIV